MSCIYSCFTSMCTVPSDRRSGCRYSNSCAWSASCSTSGRIRRSAGGLRPSSSRSYRPQRTDRRPAVQHIGCTGRCSCIRRTSLRRTSLRPTCIRCIRACADPSQVKGIKGHWRIRYNPVLLLTNMFLFAWSMINKDRHWNRSTFSYS
jgi:hypothetical protein